MAPRNRLVCAQIVEMSPSEVGTGLPLDKGCVIKGPNGYRYQV